MTNQELLQLKNLLTKLNNECVQKSCLTIPIVINYIDKMIGKKSSILDKQEKKYLSAVIKPFKNVFKYIYKTRSVSIGYEYIVIMLKDTRDNDYSITLTLPYFKAGTMYKDMELDKEYRLKELGLE